MGMVRGSGARRSPLPTLSGFQPSWALAEGPMPGATNAEQAGDAQASYRKAARDHQLPRQRKTGVLCVVLPCSRPAIAGPQRLPPGQLAVRSRPDAAFNAKSPFALRGKISWENISALPGLSLKGSAPEGKPQWVKGRQAVVGGWAVAPSPGQGPPSSPMVNSDPQDLRRAGHPPPKGGLFTSPDATHNPS